MKFKYIIILTFVTVTLSAQNSKVKNLEDERKKISSEIGVTTELLKQTSDSKKNTIYRLNLISDQISSRKKVISLLNIEIDTLDNEIKFKENEINVLEQELEFKKNNYAKSLQQMYSHKNVQDKLLFIFAGDDFAQSYRRMHYLKQYSEWQKQQGIEIKAQQDQLITQKEKLSIAKNNKLALVGDREKEAKNLKNEETVKQGEVKSLTSKEKELKTELDKKTKQAQELNRQIEKIIAEEIAKAKAEAERQKKANEKAEKAKKTDEIREVPQAETAGGYAMTKEERQLSSDFASNKGKLPFPLRGSYKIISPFGEQQPEGLKYVILPNNGIDIQTTIPNNEAKSVFDGEVTKIFVVPGYNNSVIIRHGNYITLYSNLSEIYVKSKDKVRTGQAIGKIFTDYENKNQTVLHFELWKETNKLNPMGWLNK